MAALPGSGHARAMGRSLARAGWRPQVQPATWARSSSGRALVRSDGGDGSQGQTRKGTHWQSTGQPGTVNRGSGSRGNTRIHDS